MTPPAATPTHTAPYCRDWPIPTCDHTQTSPRSLPRPTCPITLSPPPGASLVRSFVLVEPRFFPKQPRKIRRKIHHRAREDDNQIKHHSFPESTAPIQKGIDWMPRPPIPSWEIPKKFRRLQRSSKRSFSRSYYAEHVYLQHRNTGYSVYSPTYTCPL